MSCFKNIIGIADSDCACTSTGRPPDYDKSASGLFLTDLTPVAAAFADCGGDVWTDAVRAIAQAEKTFRSDLYAAILAPGRYKTQFETGSGVLGRRRPGTAITKLKNKAVLVIACAPVRGGQMKISNIHTAFSAAGSFTAELYSSDGDKIDDIPLNTENGIKDNAVDITLPMTSRYSEILEYYIVWDLDSANLPHEMDIKCSSCGYFKPVFDRNNWQMGVYGTHRRDPWADFISVGYQQVDTLTEMFDSLPDKLINKMPGVGIEVDFSCSLSDVVCQYLKDFNSDLAYSIALAIQYKAAAIFGAKVLSRPTLNREALIVADDMQQNIEIWEDKYSQHLINVSSEVDVSGTDCVTCTGPFSFKRRQIS